MFSVSFQQRKQIIPLSLGSIPLFRLFETGLLDCPCDPIGWKNALKMVGDSTVFLAHVETARFQDV